MTIDHIGFYLFPSIMILRFIGRIAFPCFLYTTIRGTERTSNYKRYISQMVLCGIVTAILTGNLLNVMFLLILFSLSLKYRYTIVVCLALSLFTEYSMYGFLLGWSIYWMTEKDKSQGIGLFLLMQLIRFSFFQWFSVLAIPFLIMKKVPLVPRVPKLVGYMYYPIHQIPLIIIKSVLT